MKCSIAQKALEAYEGSILAVGLFSDASLEDPEFAALERATAGRFGRLWQSETKREQPGVLFRYVGLDGIAAERLWVVSLGERARLTKNRWARAAQALAQALASGPRGEEAGHTLAEVSLPDLERAERLFLLTRWMAEASYRYSCPLGAAQEPAPEGVERVVHLIRSPEKEQARILADAEALAAGINTARFLADLPANLCTPDDLARQAKALAERVGLRCTIYGKKELEKLGMHALLAVAQGSKEPPRFIVLEYCADGKKTLNDPVALVGKGITFDAGGICLKPAQNLDEMRYDMAGAAAVLGAIEAVARMGLKLNLVVAIPAAENLPSGSATRPGDVVRTYSGQTVEILNTDAEGRLVLCDALTYVQRALGAKTVVDVATLTGAIIVALGKEASGLLGNDETLIAALQQAGERAFDRAWPLPLWEEYDELLKSRFADLANISSDRGAGSIVGAAFLKRFIEPGVAWAHLDIAGTAWRSGEQKGATGRPIPLLVEWLRRVAERRS